MSSVWEKLGRLLTFGRTDELEFLGFSNWIIWELLLQKTRALEQAFGMAVNTPVKMPASYIGVPRFYAWF